MKLLFSLLSLLCLAAAVDAARIQVCIKRRNGSYRRRSINSRWLDRIVKRGGGKIGAPVPGKSGFVFDKNCRVVKRGGGTPPKPKCCSATKEPGRFGNPLCFEGAACCPDGNWSCSIGDGRTFPCGGELISSGFGKRCEGEIACPQDAKLCPDGETSVGRDPNNGCSFFPCPDPKPKKCCPATEEPGRFGNPFCSDGAKCCPDGRWTCGIGNGSFPCGGQQITSGFGKRCEGGIACTQDAKLCPDGKTSVGRDPNNGCAFFPCPEPEVNCETCPFGYFDGCNGCSCTPTGLAICTLRACGPGELQEAKCNDDNPRVCDKKGKTCPGGLVVFQDPKNNCQYPPCKVFKPSCETCPAGLFDGCNTCGCDRYGKITGCTEKYCRVKKEPRCL